jgi:hypothetical protein
MQSRCRTWLALCKPIILKDLPHDSMNARPSQASVKRERLWLHTILRLTYPLEDRIFHYYLLHSVSHLILTISICHLNPDLNPLTTLTALTQTSPKTQRLKDCKSSKGYNNCSTRHRLMRWILLMPKIYNLVRNTLLISSTFWNRLRLSSLRVTGIWRDKKISMRKWERFWSTGLLKYTSNSN